MAHNKFSINPTRRDRFVFQYPPFETMKPEEMPDFSTAVSEPKDNGFQLYVHIPFCRVRCTFCYYNMIPNTFRTVVDPYVEALHKEIDMVSDLPYLQDREVETIYFGGGTPTYLKEHQLEALISHIKERFRLAPGLEFTCESEPTTVTESKLKLLKNLGVTRMSFGIQSFEKDIAFLNGRIAKPNIVSRALNIAKKQDFRVTNIDLMSGMLDETMKTWKYSIDTILDYEPEHMTIYRMEIKPGTQLFPKLQLDPKWREKFVGDEKELEMIEYAEERFADAGYRHQTHFSWIRKPEFEHLHRTNCWQGKDLICMGESAFGYANGYLYQNVHHHRPYCQAISEGSLPIDRSYKLSLQDKMTSYMVMGMKLLNISRVKFNQQFGTDPLAVFPSEIAYLVDQGAVEVNDADIRVTPKGCLYADSFLQVFYTDQHRDMDELAVGTPAFDKMSNADLLGAVKPVPLVRTELTCT